MAHLTVSKLGERAGVSPDTIRYYEREGLLPQAQRTNSGYRLYNEHTADRVRFIKGGQRLGLRLRVIRELLGVLDRGLCPCGHTEALLREHIAAIGAEITRLRELRGELAAMLGRFPADACPDPEGKWLCEGEFIARGGEES